MGIPGDGILQLFVIQTLTSSNKVISGRSIVGVVDGIAWFNVWQIILFEPDFKIGTRFLMNPHVSLEYCFRGGGGGGGQRSSYSGKDLGGVFVEIWFIVRFRRWLPQNDVVSCIPNLRQTQKSFKTFYSI